MHMNATHGIENLLVGIKCEMQRLCPEMAPGEELLDPAVNVGCLIHESNTPMRLWDSPADWDDEDCA